LAAVVVSVAEGAPVPAVETVAGVPASCAPIQRVTVIIALCCPVWALTVALIVELVPPEVTGAVYRVLRVWFAVVYEARDVNVAVEPVIVGAL